MKNDYCTCESPEPEYDGDNWVCVKCEKVMDYEPAEDDNCWPPCDWQQDDYKDFEAWARGYDLQ